MKINDQVVELELHEGAALVRLNRPAAHNAVDDAVMTRLEEILDVLDSDPAILAVALTATGHRTFCSGGDLGYFASIPSRDDGLAMSRRMRSILDRLWNGPRLVIAAVNGRALGGGCEMLTACHYRLAVPEASFAFVQAANGVTTGWGGGERLLRQLGRARALELLATAREVGADEALRLGLVDRVVPAAELVGEALEIAGRVGRRSPATIRSFLELARAVEERPPHEAREIELTAFGESWTSAAFRRVLDKHRQRRRSRGGGQPR